jgi:thioesterase domain-containing protein
MQAAEFNQFLHEQIPLTAQMQIGLQHYDGNRIALTAPLEPNINHKSTAFGGSVYSVAVLTGWSLLFLTLREHDLQGHIVIQDSEIEYLKPVQQRMVMQSQFDSIQIKEKFIRQYQKRARARVKLAVACEHRGQLMVRFTGRYVVHA